MQDIANEVDKHFEVAICVRPSQLDRLDEEYSGMCCHIGEEPVLVDQLSKEPDRPSMDDARTGWLKGWHRSYGRTGKVK